MNIRFRTWTEELGQAPAQDTEELDRAYRFSFRGARYVILEQRTHCDEHILWGLRLTDRLERHTSYYESYMNSLNL